MAHVPGASIDDLVDAPFVWIGTVEEIRANLGDHRTSPGIERFMVRARAVVDVRRIVGDGIDG